MNDVTFILAAVEQGDPQASAKLLPLIYDELRGLAARKLAQERPGQTLSGTALVHEAYIRLVASSNETVWQGRRHFFAAAAEAMRRILVENARRKLGPQRGGHLHRADVDIELVEAPLPDVDLIALDEALNKLSSESVIRAELVKLRFFAGCSVAEAADLLEISVATADRYWTYARTWLYAELSDRES
jgi:RNA polymerase sigma factor (TIGR02999 family)